MSSFENNNDTSKANIMNATMIERSIDDWLSHDDKTIHYIMYADNKIARKAGEEFAKDYIKSQSTNNKKKYKGVAIFSSDFTRARETASIFCESLQKANIPVYSDDIIVEKRLRERYFGELNGGSDTRYQEVWDIDINNPDHDEFKVESANSVLERTTKLITELDAQLSNGGSDDGTCWMCVLVAHGDVLQIMQTGFLKHEDAARHRSLEHLETSTIRELLLA